MLACSAHLPVWAQGIVPSAAWEQQVGMGVGEERLHLASTLFHQRQPSSLTPPLVLSWPCSLNCRIGLHLPRTFTRTAEEESQNFCFLKKSSELRAHLGRMFVFHGRWCPCFQNKRLCKCTPACGVHGEWTLSPLFSRMWTKP